MPIVSINVQDGHSTIGGNKILIEHKDTRIFLDFGMNFKQHGFYFSEFLNPRKCAALRDFFEFELLPEISGIYREDYLEHMDMPKEEKSIDAVFLSHAHADHAQYIHFLRWDIPIYCTEPTQLILKSVQETGNSSFSGLIDACETFRYYINSKNTKSRIDRKKKEYIHERDFHTMEPDTKYKVGSMEIEMVPVDHSLPGACGFIVYTNEGNIVYTGDIRFHGSNGHLSHEFVNKAKKASPRWLLCEGTRIDSEIQDSEKAVHQQINEHIKNTQGLVFVEHPIRDIDRVNSIYQAARENGREFAVPMKLAHLIETLGVHCPFSLDNVKILIQRKNWGLITKKDMDLKLISQDYANWERRFLEKNNWISRDNLNRQPEKYVVSMSIWEINQLSDVEVEGSIWIKSSCEPFCEEMELDEERKRNWLEHFDIPEYSAHASGHASGYEIRKMI